MNAQSMLKIRKEKWSIQFKAKKRKHSVLIMDKMHYGSYTIHLGHWAWAHNSLNIGQFLVNDYVEVQTTISYLTRFKQSKSSQGPCIASKNMTLSKRKVTDLDESTQKPAATRRAAAHFRAAPGKRHKQTVDKLIERHGEEDIFSLLMALQTEGKKFAIRKPS